MVRVAQESELRTATDAPAAGADRTVAAWLDVLDRLVRLPEPVRRELRLELETHLNDRVRDLVIGGRVESEAVAWAIAELGDAAELARRFESARRTSIRRIVMNLAIAAAGLTVVGASIVALRASGDASRAGGAAFVPAEQYERERGIDPGEAPPDALVTVAFDDVHAADAFALLDELIAPEVVVHRSELEEEGIDLEGAITLHLRDVALPRALDLLVDRFDGGAGTVAWWTEGGTIEVSTRTRALRRTVTLTSYRIDGIIDAIIERYAFDHEATVAQISGLIHSLVEPERWRDNGGDLGQLHVVGGTMFVQAPRAMQDQVAWILAQLVGPEGAPPLDPDHG